MIKKYEEEQKLNIIMQFFAAIGSIIESFKYKVR